jgi:hypothetical protein
MARPALQAPLRTPSQPLPRPPQDAELWALSEECEALRAELELACEAAEKAGREAEVAKVGSEARGLPHAAGVGVAHA